MHFLVLKRKSFGKLVFEHTGTCLFGSMPENIAYISSWRPKMQTSSKALFEYDNEGVIILTSIK